VQLEKRPKSVKVTSQKTQVPIGKKLPWKPADLALKNTSFHENFTEKSPKAVKSGK